tara:strand:- start:20046 stop:21419 length:1374 start_codon:yes stop_codon:yes gene_type:complete
MKIDTLLSLSPIEGRYYKINEELRGSLSEFGLMKYRLIVEIEWFRCLSNNKSITHLSSLSVKDNLYLSDIIKNFDIKEADKIKRIESKTNHDVKAVEYYIKDKFKNSKTLQKKIEYIHFGCTSEDINNLAYSLMLKESQKILLENKIQPLLKLLARFAKTYSKIPMLSRTHGQTASPTTLGKEFSVYFLRLNKVSKEIKDFKFEGKINGAVGNFNAHLIAYPKVNWNLVSKRFVKSLGLEWNSHTTQVEPKDNLAKYLHHFVRFNNILIDLSRDIWGYISIGYFKQKIKKGEIGSSTMPHKVNPIDFENAEGNLGVSNSSLSHIANNVVLSRWQRDLTDSTIMRNVGVGFGHFNIALNSLLKGLNKLEVDKVKIKEDLESSWEVITEAIQTILRKNNISEGYELLKSISRGKSISQSSIRNFINTLDIPKEDKKALMILTPSTYIGLSAELSKDLYF